ncbi:MAG: PepSY-associated TM helix domain-containing protein [Chroococcidiopsis sp.]
MKSKTLRSIAFSLHRYIGLAVGLIIIIVGVTGSFLVFQKEFDQYLVQRQFGEITPQPQRVAIESVVNTVKAAYSDRPELKLASIDTLPHNPTYRVRLRTEEDKTTDIYVNSYTGKILGDRNWDNTLIGIVFQLHYTLLAGDIGIKIVGIVAFLLLILTITGIFLWSGWRKLISGFKIKWQAHPKRVNYDVHKVAGIVTVIFLGFTAFTGFCWNFYNYAEPAIYALTLSPYKPEPVSQPIPGKSTIGITEILKIADVALPNAETTYINFPTAPEAAFAIYKKRPQELNEYGDSSVYLDQYSGKILKLIDGHNLPLAEKVLGSFTPLHYGTFWGLPSRILYVFVGLAPLILFVTGFVMWRYRYRGKKIVDRIDVVREPVQRH